MIWTKDSAKNYLLNFPNEEIKIATEIILAELDDAMTELKYLGIDEKTLAAKNYLESLPSLPMTYTEDEKNFIDELNTVVEILRKNPAVWLGIKDLPHEIWRDVEDFVGIYQVSNYSRLKSFHKGLEKILYPNNTKIGYTSCWLKYQEKENRIFFHRLVAKTFLPNPKNKPQVNHKDGNKKNNCVWNLEWATASENITHAFQTGLRKPNVGLKGADNGHASFTNEQAAFIKKVYKPRDKNFGCHALARSFDVSPTTIQSIVHGKTNYII